MATKIIIKNSAVEGKVPDGTAIDAAELAINLKDQKLYSKDADGNVFELGNSNINNGGTDDKPDGPEIGDLYFDTDLEILLVWNGTDWEQVILGGDSVWIKDGNNIRPADPLNDVQVGGTAADPNIELNASGSATFAGTVISHNDANGSTLFQGSWANSGYTSSLNIKGYSDNLNSNNSEHFKIEHDFSGFKNSYINFLRGTGQTDGYLAFGTQNADRAVLSSDGNLLIGGTLPSAPNISLNADGTGIFKQYLEVNKNTDDNTLGFLVTRNNNYTPGNYALLNNGNGLFINTGDAQGNNSKIALNADGTGLYKANNSSVYDPTSLFSTGQALTIQNLQGGANGYSTGIRFVTAGAGNNAASSICSINTDSDGDAALAFRVRDNADGEVERVRIDSSGDVKIGGTLPSAPNISLNADGSGVFSGGVKTFAPRTGDSSVAYFQAGNPVGDGSKKEGVFVQDNGLVSIYKSTYRENGTGYVAALKIAGSPDEATAKTVNYVVYGNGTTKIGGTLPSSPNISLNANGSASLTRIGFKPLSDSDAFIQATNQTTGKIVANHYGNGDIKLGSDVVAESKIRLNGSDGSATFAGYVKSTNGNGSSYLGASSGTGLGINNSSDVTTIELNYDGSAEFAGDVGIGGTLPSAPNISLNANGSAEFAGGVNGSFIYAGELDDEFSRLNSNNVSVRNDGDASNNVFNVYNGGTTNNDRVINFNADGSANFAGNITAGNVTFNLEPENPANYTTTEEEYEVEVPVLRPDGPVTTDLVDGEPEQEMQTITRTREVTTYTGPTMNVKDTLVKITEALTQLKTAAASATTYEELQTAIDTALADV